MKSLIEHVRSIVDPRQYYSKVFPDVRWSGSGIEARTICIFHKDTDPSLHFNPETGAWFCHGCEACGNSIISFHARLHELTKTDAALEIFEQFVRPIVPERSINRWARALKGTPTAYKYLVKQRFISREVITSHELGWSGSRIVIPIRNDAGICINAKSYDPLAKKHNMPKMLNYREEQEPRSYGSPPSLYPYSSFDLAKEMGYIVLCEGEFDALMLISQGIPAITPSAGAKAWNREWDEMFRGLRVIVAYDNDTDGNLYAKKRAVKNLRKLALEIRRLKVPLKFGKDVTDWQKAVPADKAIWESRFRKAPLVIENPEDLVGTEISNVPLDQASQAKWFNRRIEVDALVTGKDTAPYMLPQEFRATCNKTCDDCPLAESGKDFKECKMNPTDPQVLSLIDKSEETITKKLLSIAKLGESKDCEAKIEVTKTFNLEQLLLIPTLDSNTSQYVLRGCYYVGHGLNSNRAYRFEGVTVSHPHDQHTTHLFDKAKAVQDEIDTFKLTDELKQRMKIFQPGATPLDEHFNKLAEWQSRHITKIRQRSDLHIAVDLAFHSVNSFNFNFEFLPRGMLDVLVIGDTRCGKGFVTEGLMRYYGLGEMASGENCSFAGLIGGLENINKRFIVKWGIIPLNHNRFVAIDEASSISPEDWSRMSRVRSEGVAEISKIVREVTRSNTRLVWLSNTRDGRPIMHRNAGVQAIKDLVGANEDISRFDFAVTVATNEVDSEVINRRAVVEDLVDKELYPRDICRALVLWAWSRKPDQIKFTEKATQAIIDSAIEFGRKYSSSIPLVQAENIRVKLAKISAAIAARVFSCDPSGSNLLIKSDHIEYACDFLKAIYAKPSMGYDAFSRVSIRNSTTTSEDAIEKVFKDLSNDRMVAIDGFLELHRITPDNLEDYIGDLQTAKMMIGELVKLHCITRVEQGGNWYLKNPTFTTWLKRQRKDINVESTSRNKGRRSDRGN